MFKYFNILEPWLEPKFKLIAQPPKGYDPGDAAQREGMFMLAAYILLRKDKMSWKEYDFIRTRYCQVVDLLDDPNHPGLLRRYPDPVYWGGLSDRLSRDQCIPNLIAMGLVKRQMLLKFFVAHLKYRALLFTTNTRKNWAWPPGHPKYDPIQYKWKLPDLTVLSFWSLYIRGFKIKSLKPLLWLFDLEILVNVLIKIKWSQNNPEESDDLNLLCGMYQAELSMPTFPSKLSFWLYSRFRKFPRQEVYNIKASNPMQACMNHYFRNRLGNEGPKLEIIFEEVNNHMADSFTWSLRDRA